MATNLSLPALKRYLTEGLPDTRFQIDSHIRDSFCSQDLRHLRTNGLFQNGKGARMLRGAPSQCHENALRLVCKNPSWTWMYGFALSADGCWRVHSWVENTQGRIIETTEPRLMYFGMDARAMKKVVSHLRRGALSNDHVVGSTS